jgi:putative spermidine/putrescine transport system permease protein
MLPKSKWPLYVLLLPGILIIGITFLLPFVLLAMQSFWTYKSIFMFEPIFTFANYAKLFTDSYYLAVYGRTIKLALISTAITLVLAYPLARYISRLSTGSKGFMLSLVALPLIGGAMIQTMGWMTMMMRYGIINGSLLAIGLIDQPITFLGSELGILIGLVQSFIPLMVLPLVASLGAIDSSLEDAAKNLGANPMRTFFEVVFPLSLPGVIAGTVLTLMANLTMFVTPSILGQNKIMVFGTLAYQQAIAVGNWPFASAFAIFFLLMVGGLAFLGGWVTKAIQKTVIKKREGTTNVEVATT